jgi:hypothetical protein
LTAVDPKWKFERVELKYLLGEFRLFSISFPAARLDMHFSRLLSSPVDALAALREFPERIELAVVRSQPTEKPLPRFSLLPEAIRYVPAHYDRYTLSLEGSFEDYLKRFSAKTRSTLTRKLRRFADFSGEKIHWRAFGSREEMADFRILARQVSGKTYQERLLHEGLPEDDNFWQRVADLADRNSARGYILFHAQRPIAYLFCPAEDGFLLYRYLGYDPEFRRWSPGTVLLCLALESLFAEQAFRAFDFFEGGGDYKRLFSTESTQCADVYFFRRTPRNLFLLALHSGLFGLSRFLVNVLDLAGVKRRVKSFFRRTW